MHSAADRRLVDGAGVCYPCTVACLSELLDGARRVCPVGRWRRTEGTSRREQRRAASGPLKAPSAYPGCEEPTSGRATTSRRAAGLVGQTADKEPRGGSIRAGERTPVMWVVIYRRLVDELGEQAATS